MSDRPLSHSDGSLSRRRYPGRYRHAPGHSYIPIDPADDKRKAHFPAWVFDRARELEPAYLEVVLPAVLRHAHRYFRDFPWSKREDLIAEAVALSWHLVLKFLLRGNYDPIASPGLVASRAVKEVCKFNLVTGRPSAKDVLSRRAQLMRGFRVFPYEYQPEDRGPSDDAA